MNDTLAQDYASEISSSQEGKYRDGLTKSEWTEATKFNSLDWGWIIIGIGGAIGAGIVFLPVQVGLQGLWIFILSAILGYPALYMFQKLFINTMLEAKVYTDYPAVLTDYIGKNFSAMISFLYFAFLMIYVCVYSTVLNNDSVAFMDTFGVTQSLGFSESQLARNPLYGFLLILALTTLGSRGERALMRISTFMVLVKICVVIGLAVLMFPRWNIANIMALPDIWTVVKQTIIMMPFTMVSILILQSLSPMIISYRTNYKSLEVARYRGLRAFNITFFILLFAVMFFTVSLNLGLSHEQAVEAYAKNISAVAIVAQSSDGFSLKIFSLILNIFAVVTAYIAVSLAFRDVFYGLAINILSRFIPGEKINKNYVQHGIFLFTVITCWLVIVFNAPVLSYTSIGSPIMGLIGCMVPAYIVYMTPSLKKYQTISIWYIIFAGLLLIISPFLAFS